MLRLEHTHPSKSLFSWGGGHKTLQAGDIFVSAPFLKSCIWWYVFLKDGGQEACDSSHSHLFLSYANHPAPIPTLIDTRPMDALNTMVIFSCFLYIDYIVPNTCRKWICNVIYSLFFLHWAIAILKALCWTIQNCRFCRVQSQFQMVWPNEVIFCYSDLGCAT